MTRDLSLNSSSRFLSLALLFGSRVIVSPVIDTRTPYSFNLSVVKSVKLLTDDPETTIEDHFSGRVILNLLFFCFLRTDRRVSMCPFV